MPDWVKQTIYTWLVAASVTVDRMFRRVSRSGTIWGNEMTEKVVWHVVNSTPDRLALWNSRRMTFVAHVRGRVTTLGDSRVSLISA
ncbi:MAG: hypothetical protein WBR10_20385 [Candidatus Acidiferrum sp.]